MDIEKNLNNNLIIANHNAIDNDIVEEKHQNNDQIQSTVEQRQQQQQHLKKHRRLYAWIKSHLWIFPLLLSMVLFMLCIIPYILSINYNTVDPILPYISDTGGLAPGAIVFSQLLDFMAILIFISCWIRYKQIKFYLNENFMDKNLDHFNYLHRLNRHSFWLSIITSLAAIGVGNIRTTESLPLHMIMAISLFSTISIYCCYCTHLARILYREFNIESKPITMMFCTIITFIGFIITCTCELINRYQVGNENFHNNEFRMHWPETDKQSYYVHVTCTTFEWITVFSLAIFVLCIYRRFRMIGSK
uniref:DNA damage-regulated autophagy modulator protein 2-like n=1 Tax=Dermatophagoides pteronyssinus TaxID=6956 RepID=A0A6P6YI26_DERPT|nr:DNA damage-regulated autophagy modulator protein 2-like [Dermatophagoides pteronyssinus]